MGWLESSAVAEAHEVWPFFFFLFNVNYDWAYSCKEHMGMQGVTVL